MSASRSSLAARRRAPPRRPPRSLRGCSRPCRWQPSRSASTASGRCACAAPTAATTRVSSRRPRSTRRCAPTRCTTLPSSTSPCTRQRRGARRTTRLRTRRRESCPSPRPPTCGTRTPRVRQCGSRGRSAWGSRSGWPATCSTSSLAARQVPTPTSHPTARAGSRRTGTTWTCGSCSSRAPRSGACTRRRRCTRASRLATCLPRGCRLRCSS
mmetsp:Transcript_32786/g.81483  ORF Transcript_32786/g.81483 Transcript_32786/m.81483 type:complete len:212 (-) Transcript_32786:463-1098(-)